MFEAGVGTEVRRDLMDKCNLHTILRLPTGIFYAQGINTNVLFFQKGSVSNPYQQESCTRSVWVYDLRTNMQSFGKRNPFTEMYLTPFEQVYGSAFNGLSTRTEGEYSFIDLAEPDAQETDKPELGRWRCFSREWIRDSKGDSLDISWLQDQNSVYATDLPEPLELVNEAKEELEAALAELQALVKSLEGSV